MIFSNTEFYYAHPDNISNSEIILDENESKHISSVMRRNVGDDIMITDGIGNIYESVISRINKTAVIVEPRTKSFFENKFKGIHFFIPILKSYQRLEFALEKSVELGITEFVFFTAEKSEKKKIKIERLEKIGLAAMKQSLKCYKPDLSFVSSIKEVPSDRNKNVVFDQLASKKFNLFLSDNKPDLSGKYIFGPEGGLAKSEIDFFKNCEKVKLSDFRLRSETAVVSAAANLSDLLS